MDKVTQKRSAIGFVAPQEMLAGRQPQISPHATANSTPHAQQRQFRRQQADQESLLPSRCEVQ